MEVYLKAYPEGVVELLGSDAIPSQVKQVALRTAAFEATLESDYLMLLKLPCVEKEVKAEYLARFVLANKRLPQDCEGLLTEEMVPPAWEVGCAAELFQRLDSDTIQKLRAIHPPQYDPIPSDLSILVSLFKAIVASPDPIKSGLMWHMTNRLLATREQAIRSPSYKPLPKPQLYRIVDALREFLTNHPISNDLGKWLCRITGKVLDDLGDFGNTDEYRRIAETLELFRVQQSYSMLWLRNGPEWRLHGTWKLILLDLRELARGRLDIDAMVASSQLSMAGSDDSDDHYSRLIQNLQVVFGDKRPKQLLACVGRLAESYNLDVRTLAADSPVVEVAMNLPSIFSQKKGKRGKRWSVHLITVVALLGVAALVAFAACVTMWQSSTGEQSNNENSFAKAEDSGSMKAPPGELPKSKPRRTNAGDSANLQSGAEVGADNKSKQPPPETSGTKSPSPKAAESKKAITDPAPSIPPVRQKESKEPGGKQMPSPKKPEVPDPSHSDEAGGASDATKDNSSKPSTEPKDIEVPLAVGPPESTYNDIDKFSRRLDWSKKIPQVLWEDPMRTADGNVVIYGTTGAAAAGARSISRQPLRRRAQERLLPLAATSGRPVGEGCSFRPRHDRRRHHFLRQ